MIQNDLLCHGTGFRRKVVCLQDQRKSQNHQPRSCRCHKPDRSYFEQFLCIIPHLIISLCPHTLGCHTEHGKSHCHTGEHLKHADGVGHRIGCNGSRAKSGPTRLNTRIFPSWNTLFSKPFGTPICKIFLTVGPSNFHRNGFVR